MKKVVLTMSEVRSRRQAIDDCIAALRRTLGSAEGDLRVLQQLCPHPDEQINAEFGIRTYWCKDCGRDAEFSGRSQNS